MKALYSTKKLAESERVFLIGLDLKSDGDWKVSDSLAELAELAGTAGAEVTGQGVQKLQSPQAGTFIGRGKAEEWAQACKESRVDTVIFDDELSPAQTRNLESIFDCKVIDRTALILDIFAQRARTREGKLQVELAQLHHVLPRLTRMWTHLSRQKGGIGMRGEGEKQLETDRRRIGERIEKITQELDLVRRQRSTQRRGRQRNLWPLASIVGYTNAGKSTLLNALTSADVVSEDKLFATLDPTTRRLRLPSNQNVLLSDTVGFIRKLPHHLVEAFKATLEEVIEADLLLHVVDLSHPNPEEQIQSVNQVLEEIHAQDKPTLMVFNKLDRLEEFFAGERYREKHPNSVFISARTGEGLNNLLDELGTQLRPIRVLLELNIPFDRSEILARLHEVGQVLEEDYSGETARIKVRIPPHFASEFESYAMAESR